MNGENKFNELEETDMEKSNVIKDIELFNSDYSKEYKFDDYTENLPTEKLFNKEKSKTKRMCFLFYCVISFSVAMFTLSFAATEILYAFVGDKYPSDFIVNRLFGQESSGMNFAELMLNQSFMPLKSPTYSSDETTSQEEETKSPETTVAESENTTAVPSDTTSPPVTTPDNIYDFDYSQISDGDIPIIPMDLSLYTYGNQFIYNDTGYNPNIIQLLNSPLIFPQSTYPADSPLVLIVHTHTTEAFSSEGAISYKDDGGELARSDDSAENVVAVGAVVADILNKNGIKTLHCEIIHDGESYIDSYNRSAETIKEYLQKYPTIRLVIDIHRDSIMNQSGELVRPIIEYDGDEIAQVMAVVGSDYSGKSSPMWEDNLQLALKLRESLNNEYTNICRPVSLRSTTYNQELAPMSILLEIGASGNSLSEAERAAEAVAECLSEILLPKG